MKRQNPLPRKAVGQALGSVFGISGIWASVIFMPLFSLFSIGGLAVRCFLRKSEGKSLITLFQQIVITAVSAAVIVFIDNGLNYIAIFYFTGIVLGTFYRYYVDKPNEVHEIASEPYYTGVGILSFGKKYNYSKELVYNLLDGLIACLIAVFLYSLSEGMGVSVVVFFGGICLFFESFSRFILDLKTKEDKQSGEAISSHYSGSNSQGKALEEDNWRSPKI